MSQREKRQITPCEAIHMAIEALHRHQNVIEIKHRTRVAMLFPSTESALRLVTGTLLEIHEEWVTSKAYLDISCLTRSTAKPAAKQNNGKAVA